MPDTEDVIVIDRRFHGPPESGNGGYVCGRLARFVDGPSPAVRLRVPPPLGTELAVRRAEAGVGLYFDDTLIAEGRPAPLELEVPEPPRYEAAEAAALAFRGFASHPYPSCFVCGPDRAPGDGLRIFPGPIEGRALVASPWVPGPALASEAGRVLPEFLWAALDCPGAFTFPAPARGSILLGELQVTLLGDVSADDRCVLIGWEIAHQGRKHRTGTALFDGAGACRGLGVGTWFEIV